MDVAPLHLHYWDYSNQIIPKAAYLLASRSQHATMQHSALANMLWKFPIAAGMILEVSRTFSVSFTSPDGYAENGYDEAFPISTPNGYFAIYVGHEQQ
ncbi:hypothetical protein Tco_1038097, partial [Tanacetum coccineum]